MTSEIECAREAALHVRQSVNQSLGCVTKQKFVAVEQGSRAIAMATDKRAIEHGDGIRRHSARLALMIPSGHHSELDDRPLPGVTAGGLAGRLLDLVLPPHCIACRAPTDGFGRLCADCWSDIDFIVPPYCHLCGLPFDYSQGDNAICGACSARPPSYDRARAVMRYSDVGRRLVVGFKYGDRTHLATVLARWLARAGSGLLAEADLLVPVPLHRRRLFMRRFNQSALLARSLARETGAAMSVDTLRRHRATPAQAGLSRDQRRRNVSGAFRVAAKRRSLVEGRRVMLVDDVLTTGATADACAAALRRAGADYVSVLTLARVVYAD